MEHRRTAEQALIAALALGELDPAELSGRLSRSDFTDPAAGACFEAIMSGGARLEGLVAPDLPRLLRARGELRRDGYPITEMVRWLQPLPAPAHPQAWAALLVTASTARLVHRCGTRLAVAAATADPSWSQAGRVLAVAAAQRAALCGAKRRWQRLPHSWRNAIPTVPIATPVPLPTASAVATCTAEVRLEQEVLSGLVAGTTLTRLPWLSSEDFTDPACRRVFSAMAQLAASGVPVDLVTLDAATGDSGLGGWLRPDQTCRGWTPVLARRLVATSVVRAVHHAGDELRALASAQDGGMGEAMLTAAVSRLDVVRPVAERLADADRVRGTLAADLGARWVPRLPTVNRARTAQAGALQRSLMLRAVQDRQAG